MKNVKVLGGGCSNCINTAKLIEEVANRKGVEIQLEKVEAMQDIAAAGIMSTPGVIIDGKIVHTGGVPKTEDVEKWFD